MDFTGKVVIVTGASRGIGKAVAIALGRLGASVACAARATDDNRLKLPGTVNETAEAVTAAGGQGLAVGCDLSSLDDIANMIETTASEFGGIDMLINNAAITFPGDLDLTPKRFKLIMDINVTAPLVATQLARPYLAQSDSGRILHISSVAAAGYFPHMMAYGMSKQALSISQFHQPLSWLKTTSPSTASH